MHILQWVIFLKKALLISGVFISSIIGAGFASGNEILFYFSRYGKWGFGGILVSSLLFALLQYLILSQSKQFGTNNFDEYLDRIMNKRLACITAYISYSFMLLILSAMLSGFGDMVNILFGIKKVYGIVFMLLCCYFILCKGYNAFVKSESILSLFIVISIVFVGLYIMLFREINVFAFKIPNSWASSAISYVSYNILTLTSVLCLIGKEADKKSAVWSSVITFSALFVLMIIFWYILCIYSGMISLGTLPMLTICFRQSYRLGILYTCTIFISMLTTAVSNCFVLSQKLNSFLNKPPANILIIVTAFLLSGLDFSFIVDKLYRLTGIISVFLIYFIVTHRKVSRL